MTADEFLRSLERKIAERKAGILTDGEGSKAIFDPVERTSAHPAFPVFPEPPWDGTPPLHVAAMIDDVPGRP